MGPQCGLSLIKAHLAYGCCRTHDLPAEVVIKSHHGTASKEKTQPHSGMLVIRTSANLQGRVSQP